MRKILKMIAMATTGLTLAMLVSLVALIFLFDPNRYQDFIRQEVQAKTGYVIHTNNNIRWSVFPTVGFRLQNVSASASDEAEIPSIKVGDIAIQIKLLPLLHKRLEVSGVHLSDIDILIDSPQKKPIVIKNISSPSKPETINPVTQKEKKDTEPFALTVKQVSLKNAHVKWANSSNYPDVTIVSLDSNDINFHENAFPIALKLMLNNSRYSYSGEIKINGNLQISNKTERYAINSAKTNLAFNSTLENGLSLAIKSQSTLDFSYPQTQFSIKDASLTINQLALRGNMNGKFLPQEQMTGNMEIQSLNLFEFLKSIGYEINTRDPSVLDRVKGSFAFEVKDKQLALKNIKTYIDNTLVQGQLTYLNKIPSALYFNLGFEKLNLNRILPAEIGEKAVTAADVAIPKKNSTNPAPIEISGISSFKPAVTNSARNLVQGKLSVGQLLFGKLVAENLNATVNQNGPLITITPISAQFYGGQYQGKMNIELKNNSYYYTTSQQLKNVQLQALSNVMNTAISGTANITSHLNFNGQIQSQILQTLSGQMSLDIKNGSIQGGNITQILNEAYTNYKQKKTSSSNPAGKITDFETLHASVQIENGLALCQDLKMDSPLLHITGQGQINLQTQKINMRLEASVTDVGVNELTKLQKMLNGSIPLQISGTLDNPRIDVNYKEFLARLAKAQINKKINKFTKQMGLPQADGQDVKEQLKGLGNQLKTLFQ